MNERRLSIRPEQWWLLVLLIFLFTIGWMGMGGGFFGGDVPVYIHQANSGDLSQRVIHIGYIMLIQCLLPLFGEKVHMVLDALNLIAGLGIVCLVYRWGTQRGYSKILSAGFVGIALIPFLSWAEVDLLWIGAVTLAIVIRNRVGSALIFSLGMTLSPVALLTLPFVLLERRALGDSKTPWIHCGSVVVVWGVLSLIGGGDWWIGDRGVLSMHSLSPGLVLQHWIEDGLSYGLAPWVIAGTVMGRDYRWLVLLPLCLAPPDVPTGLCLAIAWSGGFSDAVNRSRSIPVLRWIFPLCVFLQLTYQGGRWKETRDRLVQERTEINHVAAQIPENALLLAPWRLGVQVSLVKTGDPYQGRWRSQQKPVRDQQDRSCDLNASSVWWIPTHSIPVGPGPWTQDISGAWVSTAPMIAWREVLGCDRR